MAALDRHLEDGEVLNDQDPNARTLAGDLPSDSARALWAVTRDIAAALKIPIERDAVMSGRAEVLGLLGEGSDDDPGMLAESERNDLNLLLFNFPVFHHLWFLWFLCWLVSGFSICALVVSWMKLKPLPGWLVISPLRYLWLVPVTMLPQWFMGREGFSFGPDTSTGILPIPKVLFYYTVFFGYGALYFCSDDRRGKAGKWWWLGLPLALLVILPLGLGFAFEGLGKEVLGGELQRLVNVALQVVYAWMVSFGLMGLFRRALHRENRTIRYLSDSSYWLYVVHLPLIVLAQIWVRDWAAPPMVKFLIVSAGVSSLLLLVYQFAVRYTWLGTLLNGPRPKPATES